MADKINQIVTFRGDKLFNGAVNIEWFNSDSIKARFASESFVFHGSEYHGVSQEDIGDGHGHKLIDTANFTQSIIRRCYGLEDQPFTLAIAGYGTGKSHLGLTLATLLNSPDSESATNIIKAIKSADPEIAKGIRITLEESSQPCLVLTLNGMRGFDLSAEITNQITTILKNDGYDTRHFDELRPRFGQATSLIEVSNETVKEELIAYADGESIEVIIDRLSTQDEHIYTKVYEFFANRGMPISVLSGESVRDVIDLVVREYCGQDKPYKSLLILFDEFGKYTEFATARSQIAGSGALQDLFEAVQANSNSVCFVGFIQFELSAYVQRIAPEYKNEILRYITRYQSANRLYLSINLETLIASLIEKKQPLLLEQIFDNKESIDESRDIIEKLKRWFPHSQNYRSWTENGIFHSVIRKGCWPLAPYSTWLLFYLASAGKHLQERSALALLGDAFKRFEAHELDLSKDSWTIAPVDLCSDVLIAELLSSEEMGQQGSIAHSYSSVIAKNGSRLTSSQRNLLLAILLSSKLGLVVDSKDDALEALAALANVSTEIARNDVSLLQEEYNVIEWDNSFNAFDILGDAVPRTQFLSFIRQRVANTYDEVGKSNLFASRVHEWCDLLADLDCDFAEENNISTREWKYKAVVTNLDYLVQQIKISSDRWAAAIDVEESRGTIIYCYVEPSRPIEAVESSAKKVLRSASRDKGVKAVPILVVLLHDIDGSLGQLLAEISIVEDLDNIDKSKFGNLIGAHKEKLLKSIRDDVSNLIKDRQFIMPVENDIESPRLSRMGSNLFSIIYNKPISFPFDGFSTARGNAANTCYELTHELMHGKLDYNGVIAKPVKVKNRAISVLNNNWGIFNKNGSISRRPAHPIIRSLTEKLDDAIVKNNKLPIADLIKDICRPPFGANIASAGLFFGVFIAPRYEEMVIMRDDHQISIFDWMQEGVFRGKFLNLSTLQSTDLLLVGESSSEWDTFLDEWEQAEDYLSKASYLERSLNLKKITPIPPSHVYREEHLKEQSKDAAIALIKLNNTVDNAWDKIEHAMNRKDCGLVSWAAVILRELLDKMEVEEPAWTDIQISSIQKDYGEARQYSIQYFDDWFPYQTPKSSSPGDIGDFKHKMLRIIVPNLKKIGLVDESIKLEQYTSNVIKKAETIASAKQMLRDAEGWLRDHSDALKSKKIADARALKETGFQFQTRLKQLSGKVDLPEFAIRRSEIDKFMAQLAENEKQLFDRASRLWDSSIENHQDLDTLSVEIDFLVAAFEGLETDLDDLLSMRKTIRHFRDCYQKLSDESLGRGQLQTFGNKLISEYNEILQDEEVPWNCEDVLKAYLINITQKREKTSNDWLRRISKNEKSIGNMSASDANQLFKQVQASPIFLSNEQKNQINRLSKILEIRLSELSIEWLIEKFKELDANQRKSFLTVIQKIAD